MNTARPPNFSPTGERLFLFLGPDKTGSTYVDGLLREHPLVDSPTAKDLFFFNRNYALGIQWYYGQFSNDGRLKAEVCHDYLFSATAAERIGALPLSMSYGVGARNPYERAISAYHFMRFQGRMNLEFETALWQCDELLGHGDFSTHLPRWQKAAGDSDLFILDFDELKESPSAYANHLFSSLGLPHLDQIPRIERNPAREPNMPGLIMRRGRLLAEALRRRGLTAAADRLKKTAHRIPSRSSPDPLPEFADLRPATREKVVEVVARSSEALRSIDGVERWPAWPSERPSGGSKHESPSRV